MKLLFDLSPLSSGHKNRGIGRYTDQLYQFLKTQADIELITPGSQQKPDLIHYPGFDLFRPSLPFFYGRKVVITIHDLIPLKFPEGYPLGIKARLSLFWQKLMARQARVILTDSHESRSDIYHFFKIDPGRVVVVPLGVSSQFVPLTKKLSTWYLDQQKITAPYILYLGDINYNKNIPALIEALHYLPKNINLVCVGHNFRPQNIPEWLVIQKIIERYQLQNRVIFINDLDQTKIETIRAIYSQAVCYVQPSLAEGFGLPVLEAMACGCLVLCSQTAALKELGGNVAFYAQPVAVELAKMLKNIMRLSPAKKKEKKREGIVWAKGFTWQRTGQATRLIYQKVINGEF